MKFNNNLSYKKYVTPFTIAEPIYINQLHNGMFKDFALSETLRQVHSIPHCDKMSQSELMEHLKNESLI